jgi:hypothetical protein
MFKIESSGIFRRKHRLVAPTKLDKDDFKKVAGCIGAKPVKARKIGFGAARRAVRAEVIATQWDGKETTNSAQPGDWIVTNLSPARTVIRDKTGHENIYVIKAENFAGLYDSIIGSNEFGQFYKAKNIVDAVYLSGGFDIFASWGQKQVADVGYLLASGHDVYGNNSDTFNATYEVVN